MGRNTITAACLLLTRVAVVSAQMCNSPFVQIVDTPFNGTFNLVDPLELEGASQAWLRTDDAINTSTYLVKVDPELPALMQGSNVTNSTCSWLSYWSLSQWTRSTDNEMVAQYPVYIVHQCRDDPSEIDTEWSLYPCQDCDSNGTLSIGIGCGIEPIPTPAPATLAPVTLVPTQAPTASLAVQCEPETAYSVSRVEVTGTSWDGIYTYTTVGKWKRESHAGDTESFVYMCYTEEYTSDMGFSYSDQTDPCSSGSNWQLYSCEYESDDNSCGVCSYNILLYPWYYTWDCASHPGLVTGEWHVDTCDACAGTTYAPGISIGCLPDA